MEVSKVPSTHKAIGSRAFAGRRPAWFSLGAALCHNMPAAAALSAAAQQRKRLVLELRTTAAARRAPAAARSHEGPAENTHAKLLRQ